MPQQQIMVKVNHGSNTVRLAFGSEAELTWESLWCQVADRFQLLPGGEAVTDAIRSRSATFTYVDSDGDPVQLVCEADLAIAVRFACSSSPPTLRLLVGLVRTHEGVTVSAAGRDGGGGGGNSGERGSGQDDPEQCGGRPQPQTPGLQPQDDGPASPSGGGEMARERSFRRFRRPDSTAGLAIACPQEPQWARADALVLAERGYRRALRPAASVARPCAEADPVAPSLPQAVPMPLPPAQARRNGQCAVRFHERRRRGERWCRRSGVAPCSGARRADSCGGDALLRRARQPYGEGPGRSRSGPISIRS